MSPLFFFFGGLVGNAVKRSWSLVGCLFAVAGVPNGRRTLQFRSGQRVCRYPRRMHRDGCIRYILLRVADRARVSGFAPPPASPHGKVSGRCANSHRASRRAFRHCCPPPPPLRFGDKRGVMSIQRRNRASLTRITHFVVLCNSCSSAVSRRAGPACHPSEPKTSQQTSTHARAPLRPIWAPPRRACLCLASRRLRGHGGAVVEAG